LTREFDAKLWPFLSRNRRVGARLEPSRENAQPGNLTGAEQIAKVAILTFLGREKCSFLTQEKRPFLG
jgi:hypothetical protein